MATHMYISLQQDDTIAQYDMNPDTGALQRLAAFSLAGMPAPMSREPLRAWPNDS